MQQTVQFHSRALSLPGAVFKRRVRGNPASRNGGFTLVELLVVISVIAVLMGILLPTLRRAREQARQLSCGSKVRQHVLAMIMYADQANNRLPLPEHGGNWFWDVDTSTVNFMLRNGMTREMFYCPSNDNQQKNMDTYWLFNTDSWDGERFTNTSNSFIVAGYAYALDLAHFKRPAMKRERFDRLETPVFPVEPQWLRTTLTKQPAFRELALDVVLSAREKISADYPNGNFAFVEGGMLEYGVHDRTSHLKTDAEPLGGNIGFLDGHVAWRPFSEMVVRYGQDRLFWW